jgi:hypothetical protein
MSTKMKIVFWNMGLFRKESFLAESHCGFKRLIVVELHPDGALNRDITLLQQRPIRNR